jgi:hypothetical protein
VLLLQRLPGRLVPEEGGDVDEQAVEQRADLERLHLEPVEVLPDVVDVDRAHPPTDQPAQAGALVAGEVDAPALAQEDEQVLEVLVEGVVLHGGAPLLAGGPTLGAVVDRAREPGSPAGRAARGRAVVRRRGGRACRVPTAVAVLGQHVPRAPAAERGRPAARRAKCACDQSRPLRAASPASRCETSSRSSTARSAVHRASSKVCAWCRSRLSPL